jgi:hypothetical protein
MITSHKDAALEEALHHLNPLAQLVAVGDGIPIYSDATFAEIENDRTRIFELLNRLPDEMEREQFESEIADALSSGRSVFVREFGANMLIDFLIV